MSGLAVRTGAGDRLQEGSHHGSADVGPSDLFEARRVEHGQSAGEYRGGRGPGLQSRHVHRMSVDDFSAVAPGEVDRRALERDADALPAFGSENGEATDPACRVRTDLVVGEHLAQSTVGRDARERAAQHHLGPADTPAAPHGKQSEVSIRSLDLVLERRAFVRTVVAREPLAPAASAA